MTKHHLHSKQPVMLARERKIEDWLRLKAKGVDDKTCQIVVKISRATFFRWHREYKRRGLSGLRPKSTRPHRIRQPVTLTKDILAKIRALRERYPFYGKAKIQALCVRQGLTISLSSVGRALHYFMQRGIVSPVFVLKAHKERKIIRKFTRSYSQRLPKYHKAPIQLDHTIINLRDTPFRVFVAYDRVTKFTLPRAYERATSSNASDFLSYIRSHWPYRPQELQVDGGSEFRGHFEQACKDARIKLFVLPPRSPKLNGGVERFNQTLQDECFLPGYYTLPANLEDLNKELEKWAKYYNEERPHRALPDKNGLSMAPIQAIKNSLICIEP